MNKNYIALCASVTTMSCTAMVLIYKLMKKAMI